MDKVKGIVFHKGMKVPVEVEVGEGWVGYPAVIVHIPRTYSGTGNLTHMIDFLADLDEPVVPILEEEKHGRS